ncbi:MAG: hypothetical protein WDN24_15070 [Sphingomonas sp.]
MHRFAVRAARGDTLTVQVGFSKGHASAVADYRKAAAQVTRRWRDFWTKGGAIDFSGSADPRAAELERRVVLSQYLSAINGAGALPPQEEGLFSNSWNGKFHLEVHPLHSAHWALWGRPELLERSLAWYRDTLDTAMETARAHRVQGAWWTKMSGPEGRNSPSTINPFIMWQQPNPILMAELLYRAKGAGVLAQNARLVEETAKLLASWPLRDAARGRFDLGPPIVPVQENHPPLSTVNPAYELEAFRRGLTIAQAWRERRGLAREPQWDRVIAGLPVPAARDGLYLPVASEPDFWKVAQSPECSRHATPPKCRNRDHPSFLMAYGLIGGKVDVETMRRTLRAVESDWDLRQTWGWDFPRDRDDRGAAGRARERSRLAVPRPAQQPMGRDGDDSARPSGRGDAAGRPRRRRCRRGPRRPRLCPRGGDLFPLERLAAARGGDDGGGLGRLHRAGAGLSETGLEGARRGSSADSVNLFLPRFATEENRYKKEARPKPRLPPVPMAMRRAARPGSGIGHRHAPH